MLPALEDPEQLTAEERIRELAALLAEGVRRARPRATLTPEIAPVSEESSASRLEFSVPSRPDGSEAVDNPPRTESAS